MFKNKLDSELPQNFVYPSNTQATLLYITLYVEATMSIEGFQRYRSTASEGRLNYFTIGSHHKIYILCRKQYYEGPSCAVLNVSKQCGID